MLQVNRWLNKILVLLILIMVSRVVEGQDQPTFNTSPAVGSTQSTTTVVSTTPPQGLPPSAPPVMQSVVSAPPVTNSSVVTTTQPVTSTSVVTTTQPGVTSTSPSMVTSTPPGVTTVTSPPPVSAPPRIVTPGAASNADQFQKWIRSNQQIPPFASQPVRVIRPAKKRIIVTKALKGPNAPLVQSPPLTYDQSRQIMLNSAPPSEPPSPDSVAAFNAMTRQNVPLTPQQVVQLRQVIDASQRAATIPATVPPKPVSSTIMINLAPGTTPPAIRLAQGYISTLVFVDSTGAPWPIAAYVLGDPKATNIQWDGKSNILLIQGVTPYSDSNLIVQLVGLVTPIALEMVSGQRVVDFRTDIHVSGIGPNSKDLPIGTPLPESANQLLLSVLDGVAPPGSRQLTVSGGDAQVWLLGDKMYLRTRLTVLSPGWIGKMSSPDGMMAYEMQKTSSVLVSQYGNPIELRIEGL